MPPKKPGARKIINAKGKAVPVQPKPKDSTKDIPPPKGQAPGDPKRADGKKEVPVPDSSESFQRKTSMQNRNAALGQSPRDRTPREGSLNQSRSDSMNSKNKKSARNDSPELSQRNMQDDDKILESMAEEDMLSNEIPLGDGLRATPQPDEISEIDGDNLSEEIPKRPKTIDKSIGTEKVSPAESSPDLDGVDEPEPSSPDMAQSQQVLPALPSRKSLVQAELSQKNVSKTVGNSHKSLSTLKLPEIKKPVRPPPPPKPYTLYDFVFPGGIIGKMAKLEKVVDVGEPELMTILEKFKFDKPRPVIVCSGSRNAERGKFLAGIVRAAHRTDAVLIDSGIKSGIENYCIRRETTLIGVYPECMVSMPKLAAEKIPANVITNGHTHNFMICDKLYHKWGTESKLCMEIAENIRQGSQAARDLKCSPCKMIMVVLGDDESSLGEIKIAVSKKIPIILVDGSDLCSRLIKFVVDGEQLFNENIEGMLKEGHFYVCKNQKSEDIAAFVHFFITVTPY